MTTPARRLLGLTMDGRPIYEPHPNASAIIFAAMGGGKTTCVSMTAILSLLADKQQALFINDVKNGEIAAQIAQMCLKHGRKFGVVDDCQVMGADYPHRIHLNPFGALQAALLSDVSHLPFVVESTVHTLIDEPADDKKNFYWREAPREFLELGIKILIHHNPRLLTPGGLHALLSDPHTWNWEQANHLMLRCDTLRTKETKLFRERYDTRVEIECRRLLNDGASPRRELKPNWIGQDRFNADDLVRQARRNVRTHHENRLERVDALETRELRAIVWKSARENQIEGTARDAFARATNRRLGVDRRQQRGRS